MREFVSTRSGPVDNVNSLIVLYTIPNNHAAASTNANPDPPATEAAAFVVEDAVEPDEVAVELSDAEAVAGPPVGRAVELAPLPPLPAVVVTDEGGKEMLVAGAVVF